MFLVSFFAGVWFAVPKLFYTGDFFLGGGRNFWPIFEIEISYAILGWRTNTFLSKWFWYECYRTISTGQKYKVYHRSFSFRVWHKGRRSAKMVTKYDIEGQGCKHTLWSHRLMVQKYYSFITFSLCYRRFSFYTIKKLSS